MRALLFVALFHRVFASLLSQNHVSKERRVHQNGDICWSTVQKNVPNGPLSRRVAVCIDKRKQLPAAARIGVIPLSGDNGAKSDFRNDRVKRAQGFTEGGCASQ